MKADDYYEILGNWKCGETMMELEFHLLDLKYQGLKGRNRKAESRLLASLVEQGQLSPIIVLPGKGDPPRHIVVDGFKRIRALKRIGRDTVKAVVWPEDEVSALIAINHLQRSVDRNALDDAFLIKALQDYHGLSYLEIGRRLGRSKSWVGRRLGLIMDFPLWLQNWVRDGSIQCSAAEKYILPLSRSNSTHAKILVKNIRSLHLSIREIGTLYCAWRDGNENGRQLVIHQPLTVLKIRQAVKKDSHHPRARLLNGMEDLLALTHQLNQCWASNRSFRSGKHGYPTNN